MPCLVQLFKPSSTHQALVSGDEDVMLTYSTDPHTDLPHCLDTAWPAQVDSPLSHPTLILSLWQLPINNIINISSLSCCVHVMCGHVIHTHTSPQCHVWSCDSHTHTHTSPLQCHVWSCDSYPRLLSCVLFVTRPSQS